MKRDWQRKQTQVVWADLEAWQQQLLEDHQIRCDFDVAVFLPQDSVQSAIVMEAYRCVPGKHRELVKRDYFYIDLTVSGHAEQGALRMISKLLLEVENEKERAERQAAFPF